MSHPAERRNGGKSPDGEGNFEALRRSPELRGPVEPLDDTDHSNGHLALIYDTEEELFAATVPFIRQGLEQNEQCVYVLDERSQEEIIGALQADGIDVDRALESGALVFTTVQETYLRSKPFDPEDTISFFSETADQALDDHQGLRVVAGMNWIDEVSFETFLEYEGWVNAFFEETAVMGLCHFDRESHSATVIRDMIRTHPHLISNDTVCHNFYYTPPGELFGPDQPATDVERMRGMMEERTAAKEELKERQRYLRRKNEIISDPERPFEWKLQALFELGCERFDLAFGAMARVDTGDDRFQVEAVSNDDAHVAPGVELPLSETYVTTGADSRAAESITDLRTEGDGDSHLYQEFGIESYLCTYVTVDGGTDRAFFFASPDPRAEDFSADDREFIRSMGQWLQHELEQRQYEQELEETVTRLRQSNDRLQEFAYAASHDLQEPLRMVSSYLQLLENRYSDELDVDAQEYIEFAVDGADRMRAMVDDLLTYASVEQADEDFETVDCNAVLARVTDNLQVRIEEADAEITVESLPTVTGDSEQLEQLFSNLISNAIKYNESDPPRVAITAEQSGDQWEFAVTDNGIGIDPEESDRIFSVFRRLHTESEYPGTGIGLSLCQEIVEHHGGDIWLGSTPGEGSTFYVSLPTRPTAEGGA